MDSKIFVKNLIEDIKQEQRKNDDIILKEKEKSSSNKEELSPFLIKHWLNFAVYYERAATYFIGGWIKGVKKQDVLINYAHQLKDEANHFVWLKKHLNEYGIDHEDFDPPQEWKFLMEDYYPNLTELVEQLAAHNIASEMGVLGFLEFNLDRFPKKINETVKKVYKDELYHVTFAKRLLIKYCTDEKSQNKAKNAANEALILMKKAREVFVNV